MALRKCVICLIFLTIVFSQELEVHSPLKITQDDLMKILPNQQEKLKALASELLQADKNEQVAILNDYADDLLNNLNDFILATSIDIVPMPDIEEEFEWRILLITYRGHMSLTKGWLQGLSTIKRRSDVTVRYNYPYVKVSMPLDFRTLAYDYQYKAKFMGLGPSGGVEGIVSGCKWSIDLTLNMVTLKAELEHFKLETLGNMNVHFTGNILIDWMVNIFASVIIIFVQPIIKLIVEGFVRDGVEQVFTVYNQMICNFLQDCN